MSELVLSIYSNYKVSSDAIERMNLPVRTRLSRQSNNRKLPSFVFFVEAAARRWFPQPNDTVKRSPS